MTAQEIKAMEAKLNEALANQSKLLAQIEAAKEENARLTKAAISKTKVTGNVDKGTVSVYGLNARYPVSLYPSQWLRLLELSVEIKSVCAQPAIIAAAQRTMDAKQASKSANGLVPA